MVATPIPMMAPVTSSGPGPSGRNPTISRPMLTTITAMSMEPIVTITLYLMACPGIVKPSIAMKCMTQMPVVPIESPPSSSQRAFARPVSAVARDVHCRPRKQPRHDIRYARTGVSRPSEKLWTVTMVWFFSLLRCQR
jgi:hypothetical protein